MAYRVDFMYSSPDRSDILQFFIGDIVDSGTIVEKYEISFAPKKENRFALLKFLAIFTK